VRAQARRSRQSGQLGERDVGVGRLLAGAVVSQWFLGETPTASSGVATATATGVGRWWLPAAVALAALCWLLVANGLARRARGGPPPAEPTTTESAAVWLLPWIVVPTALVGLQTLATAGSLYNPRYFAFGAPAVAVAVALGLRRLGGRARVAAVTAAVLLVVPVHASQRGVNAKSAADWSQAAQQLCRSAHPGDAVYFSPRRPPVDGATTLTTRGIAVAYPRCFAGLRDVTLTRSPVEAGDLTGTSRPLAASRGALAAADVVWVLRRPSDPSAAADEALLASAGFHRETVWRGTLDEVLELRRR
jgi:mannosyltransferase